MRNAIFVTTACLCLSAGAEAAGVTGLSNPAAFHTVLAVAQTPTTRPSAAPPAQTPPPKTPAPQTVPPQTPPPRSSAARESSGRQTTTRVTMTVLVTTMQGRPIEGTWVKASGPVDRQAESDADGSVTFRNVTAGSYRLRFEHDEYVTLERDVAIQATRPVRISVALNAAPPPPPAAPHPPPVAVLAPAPPPPAGPLAQPSTTSIPDFVEKHYIGSAPSLSSPMGCTSTSTTTLLQLRRPLDEHAHADADEMLYVVAGEGIEHIGGRDVPLTAGTFAVVPRGMSHGLERRGSRPLILLSILTGPSCLPGR